MEHTSEAWKANQKRLLTSEGFVEVSYSISAPFMKLESVTEAAQNTLKLSELDKLVNEDYDVTPYTTLEPNFWPLSSQKIVPPDDGSHQYSGFISNTLCGENRAFAAPIRLQIALQEPITILPGVTITWGASDGDYPTDFAIRTYGAYEEEPVLLYEQVISDNRSAASRIPFQKEFFVTQDEQPEIKWIEIELSKWSTPYRRARVGKIFLGIHAVYTKEELLSFSSAQTFDPVSSALPKNEISFSLDNSDGTFNPYNADGLSKYMTEWQEIRTRYGFLLDHQVEWIPGGVYYLSEWNAPQNGWSASLKARDMLGLLGETYYEGKFPDTAAGVSLYALAEQVLKAANLPSHRNGENRWKLSETLRNYTTHSPLPVCSMAECLQLIANAACCTLSFDRDGILHIEPLGESSSGESLAITEENSYTKAEISTAKPLKSVDVSICGYTRDEKAKSLYSGIMNLQSGANEFVIEYSDLADVSGIQLVPEGVAIDQNKSEYRADGCTLVLHCDTEGSYLLTVSTFTGAELHNGTVTLPAGESTVEINYTGSVPSGTVLLIHLDSSAESAGHTVTVNTQDTKFYAKCCRLALTAEEDAQRNVSMNGIAIQKTETIHSIQNVPKPAAGETHALKNSLITSHQHAETVGNWLLQYLDRRKSLSLEWRADPCIDTGDVVTVQNGDAENQMCVTASEFSFTGAFKGKAEGSVIR